jgi:transcriptional regulator with XRE-family HTH domain
VRCHMSQSKVSRIENGRLLPSVIDVDRILRALGVDQATTTELLALARVANAEYQDVRASVRRGLHHRQRELAALEADATEMRHFLPTLITGLLQIPEYMRAAMDTPVEPAAGDTATAIALKLERVQLDRLVSLSWLPNIRIGVLPLSARVSDGPYHTFVIYDDHLVTIELFTGQLVLRDPKDVDHYHALASFFGGYALWDDAARSFITKAAECCRASTRGNLSRRQMHAPPAVGVGCESDDMTGSDLTRSCLR